MLDQCVSDTLVSEPTYIIYVKRAHSWSFVKNVVIYSCIWMNWLVAFLDSWSLQGTKKFVWSFMVQYRALPRIPWQLNVGVNAATIVCIDGLIHQLQFTNFISIDMFIDISTILCFGCRISRPFMSLTYGLRQAHLVRMVEIVSFCWQLH